MNSIPLALDLLDRLLGLAVKANTDFEKAAVFAAATALFKDLDDELGDAGGYAGEKLELVRWNICAIVGYDVDNGQDVQMLKAAAIGALQALRASLGK